jgi:SAM-dependent MidA family methyltransferase
MSLPASRLQNRILAEGPIPFAAFMEEALYGEGGYYRRDDPPIGEAGDYVTGSSLSPLFGRAASRLLLRLGVALGQPPDLFEVGYGTGAHLTSIVSAVSNAGCRIRAWDRISRAVPPEVERVEHLADLQEGEIEGLIFSYELFDALPVHRLIQGESGRLEELWVDLDGEGRFTWSQGELSDPTLRDLLEDTPLAPGQIADLAPGWVPLYKELAGRLGRGLLVTCDYGFERHRLLDARIRQHGTLACYTRQRVHRNPFVKVGEQDLTAHVDFFALIQAGESAGLQTVALTRQALWLTACGLFDDLQDAGPEVRQEAMALLDGEGMGEEIRVLIQARGIEVAEVLDLRMFRR